MKILIDCRTVSFARGGVEYYTANLIPHLARREINISCLFTRIQQKDLENRFPDLAREDKIHKKFMQFGRLYDYLWRSPLSHLLPAESLFGKVDILHYPANFPILPTSQAKKIVTVHDVSFIKYPQFFEYR